MEDYKKSIACEDEVSEVGAFGYEISFNNSKEKVKEHFSGLDLRKVVASGEEVIKEVAKEGEV